MINLSSSILRHVQSLFKSCSKANPCKAWRSKSFLKSNAHITTAQTLPSILRCDLFTNDSNKTTKPFLPSLPRNKLTGNHLQMHAQHVLNDLDKTTRQAQLHFIFSNIYQIKFFFYISYFQIYIQSNSLLVTIYWNGNHSTKMLCTHSH